jgi:hypothetical protein
MGFRPFLYLGSLLREGDAAAFEKLALHGYMQAVQRESGTDAADAKERPDQRKPSTLPADGTAGR